MITGKLEYYGVEFPTAVGLCTSIQSTAQNGAATEWQGSIDIFANVTTLGIGNPLLSYPLLGWVDNDNAPIAALEALAIDLFFPGWTIVNAPMMPIQDTDRSALDVSVRE
ncbi:hypothetical protein [Serratia ficaria]|uniref:hypothetical protein n=1 Tax=Serratia ficaria TaxID=61651 RepID=UPI00217C6F47|nr:hypothetical protein [Serratia ficaria]CAI1736974.1 Uncharacterised protein [Serratia ficaria]